jgi:hypothetical protein
MWLKNSFDLVNPPPALRLLVAIIFILLAVALLVGANEAIALKTTYSMDCSSVRASHELVCALVNGLLAAVPERLRWLPSGVGGIVSAVVFLYAAFLLIKSAVRANPESD